MFINYFKFTFVITFVLMLFSICIGVPILSAIRVWVFLLVFASVIALTAFVKAFIDKAKK